MTATFVLAGMRVEKEYLRELFDGVQIMLESTAFDYFVEEGEKRGQLLLALRLLKKQGANRLGSPEESTVVALKEIDDLERLLRMIDAIPVVTSWNELLQTS